MTYAGLAAAYLLAPVVLIALIAFVRKGWSQSEEPHEPAVPASTCDPACGGILALLQKERDYEQQLAEVHEELERLKALPMPKSTRRIRVWLAAEYWLPRLRRATSWWSWLAIAAWTLVSFASAWILLRRILSNPELAIFEASNYLVREVPDIMWMGAITVTLMATIFLLFLVLTIMVSALPSDETEAFREWQEAAEVKDPHLRAMAEWLEGQLQETRADLTWLQTAVRQRFGEAAASII